MKVIETQRLILRTWTEKDANPYYEINQDPKVIEYLPGSLSHEQVKDFITRMNAQHQEKGYTLWVVELKETAQHLGFVGLNYTDWKSHFTPAVEVGWRIGSQYWGQGYATEAARASLQFAFNILRLNEIVSFTVPANQRSISVMERIGMVRDKEGDFRHPKLPVDHRLSHHVLYRINKAAYLKFKNSLS